VPGFENNYLVEGFQGFKLIQKMVSMQAKTLVKITEISTAYENGVDTGFEKIKLHMTVPTKILCQNIGTFY